MFEIVSIINDTFGGRNHSFIFSRISFFPVCLTKKVVPLILDFVFYVFSCTHVCGVNACHSIETKITLVNRAHCHTDGFIIYDMIYRSAVPALSLYYAPVRCSSCTMLLAQ